MTIDVRKPPVGSRPGTLVISPDALEPVVRVFSYDADHLDELEAFEIPQFEHNREQGRKLWIDVQGLGDEELLWRLADAFSIHPLALEDMVHVPSRPKAEPYEHNLLVVTRMLRMDEADTLTAEQVSILIGDGFVLTLQEKYGDVLDPVRSRLAVPKSRVRTLGADYLGYAILDTIVDAYYPVVERIAERIEDLEESIFESASPEALRELSAVKSVLLTLRRSVSPQREALQALIRGEDELISDAVRVFLRDTFDHVLQASDAIDHGREFVSGLMNTYLTVVSNRMNEVMKTLTIVASIFVPLTFLAGIYGMNFEHMPELAIRWAYPFLLGLMALVTVGMIIYFWRKGWIGRGS